ncbi:MAG: hypothetical protein KF861_17955, partial [Planctomycetaceae bacterium]|nr:hypothetical protein [Planctomycetaceae bacterium]
FRDVVEGLSSVEGVQIIHQPEELLSTVRRLLEQQTEATRLGEAARTFVIAQQGATEQTVQVLIDLLPLPPLARAA